MRKKRPAILKTRYVHEWRDIIEQCIFDKRDREIAIRFLLDGETAEHLAEVYELTPRGIWYIINNVEDIIFAEAKRRPSQRENPS